VRISELTIAEANKVSQMDLQGNQLTSVKVLESLALSAGLDYADLLL